jgi:hypothetical protein
MKNRGRFVLLLCVQHHGMRSIIIDAPRLCVFHVLMEFRGKDETLVAWVKALKVSGGDAGRELVGPGTLVGEGTCLLPNTHEDTGLRTQQLLS